jgi:hypothetical protein
MTKQAFDNIILIGRAGAGKSEFIDFLKHINEAERLKKFHIGPFKEIDDFPWLHATLKDEDHWEKIGYPRKLGQKIENIYRTVDFNLYDFLSLKLSTEVKEKFLSNKEFYEKNTLFVEFARGRKKVYYHTFNDLFDKEVLQTSAIFFLDNTFEESMRRNEVRSTAGDKNQSILHHKIPVETMNAYYQEHDWHELTDKKPFGYIEMQGLKVPFVTVWNIPESHDFKVLEERYGAPIIKLWELYQNRQRG